MVADVMHHMKLGPNGAMLFCMEFVEKHVDQIVEKVTNQADHYFLIDCPGQVCTMSDVCFTVIISSYIYFSL